MHEHVKEAESSMKLVNAEKECHVLGLKWNRRQDSRDSLTNAILETTRIVIVNLASAVYYPSGHVAPYTKKPSAFERHPAT